MMFSVDLSSPIPLHAQIAEGIQLAIARGQWNAGDRLPTVRQLAIDLKVNSNTVARVYADLERLGVVQTRRGLGTFVRPPTAEVEAAGERRIATLCRAFVGSCAREGFTLRDILHALRELANDDAKPEPKENGDG